MANLQALSSNFNIFISSNTPSEKKIHRFRVVKSSTYTGFGLKGVFGLAILEAIDYRHTYRKIFMKNEELHFAQPVRHLEKQ